MRWRFVVMSTGGAPDRCEVPVHVRDRGDERQLEHLLKPFLANSQLTEYRLDSIHRREVQQRLDDIDYKDLQCASPTGRSAEWSEGRGPAPSFLGASGRVGSHEVEVEDRIGLVELDLYLGAAGQRSGDVVAVVAVVQEDHRLHHSALVHARHPRRLCSPAGRNPALGRVRIIRERQAWHVQVTLRAAYCLYGRCLNWGVRRAGSA